MKPLWRTAIILTAIAGATIIAILIFQKTNQPSITLTEEWTATQVIDGDSITGSQMSVELCGIDAPEVKQGEVPAQALSNEAKDKLLNLVAAADNQLMIIPVEKDKQGRTIAEVMAYGKDEADISFQEELLLSGLAKMLKSGVVCPNQLGFQQAADIASLLKLECGVKTNETSLEAKTSTPVKICCTFQAGADPPRAFLQTSAVSMPKPPAWT